MALALCDVLVERLGDGEAEVPPLIVGAAPVPLRAKDPLPEDEGLVVADHPVGTGLKDAATPDPVAAAGVKVGAKDRVGAHGVVVGEDPGVSVNPPPPPPPPPREGLASALPVAPSKAVPVGPR